MRRVVLDPNVLISGLITPRGASARLLTALRAGAFEIVVSPSLLAELEMVLRRAKFRRYATLEEVAEFLEVIRRVATMVDDPPPTASGLSEDPDDEYLVALSREAKVSALVSGDPHLLRLRSMIPVRRPGELLKEIDAEI